MISNYHNLIQRFWEYNNGQPLGSTALLIYFYLLKLGHDQNSYSVSISDIKVAKELGLTRKTVKVTKEKLQNSGVINYVTKNGLACTYTIIPDYLFQTLESETKPPDTSIPKVHQPRIRQKDIKISDAVGPKIQSPECSIEKWPPETRLHKRKSAPIPTLEQVYSYVKSLQMYDSSLDEPVKMKYLDWINNGWKNNFNRPISDWKSTIKNALPYLQSRSKSNTVLIPPIPTIRRIKATSNSEE